MQGYELEVLAGGEAILDRVAWVYTEAHFRELYRGQPLFDEIERHLRARGFELVETTAFRLDDEGQPLECDMLFRRSGHQR